MSAVTDEQPPTVEARMKAAGISQERIDRHLAAGTIQCDGVVVTDLSQPAPYPARIVIAGTQ